MPTSVITNTILNGVGTPVPDVPVSVRLYPIPGFRIDTGTEVNGLVTTATDVNGVWSLALEETANISPAGTYYIVDEAVPGDPHSYAFAVGPNDANLFDSLVTPLPVGPGFSGEVDSAIQIHEGEVDPHPGYATDEDLSTHVAHSDPHPNYATDTDVTAHNSATAVHGVPDTTALATTASLDNHTNDWTGVHGIPDTQALATDAEVATAVGNHEAAANPHPGYATDTDLAGHTHSDLMTDLANHDVDTTNVHGITDTAVLATDAEVASAVGDHAAAADPHTGYQKESEKGAANGYASLDAGTLVPVAQLATGAPDGTKFLRDDRTWVLPTGGGGVSIPQQDDPPASPVEDDLWIDTNDGPSLKRYDATLVDWEYVGRLTAPQTLGYAQVTASASGTGSVVVAQVTITVPEGRRIRITGQIRQHTHSVLAGRSSLQLWEGATQFNAKLVIGHPTVAGNATMGGNIQHVLSPSAGTHTYGFVITPNDAGTISFFADAQSPAFILVEDITGDPLPYNPASVPVGQLGYSETVANQGSIITETDLTSLSVNISVPAGRVIKITGKVRAQSTISADRANLLIKDEANVWHGNSGLVVLQTANVAEDIQAEAVISPSAGMHTYRLTLSRATGTGTLTMAANPSGGAVAFILVEDITPTPAPSSGAPGSTLGYTESVTSQTGITASATPLTGLSVTVTVPEGRRIRITGMVPQFTRTAGTTTFLDLMIKEDTTILGRDVVSLPNTYTGARATAIITPSAGTHTYYLAANPDSATTVTKEGHKSYILVEDITGSVWPEGSEVTAGMIASEAWTDWVPTLTNITLGNGSVIAKFQKIGRTVHYRFRFVLGSTSAIGTGPQFSLPFAVHADYVTIAMPIGYGALRDAGVNTYSAAARLNTNGAEVYHFVSPNVAVTATVPFAWGDGDSLFVQGTYEAAA